MLSDKELRQLLTNPFFNGIDTSAFADAVHESESYIKSFSDGEIIHAPQKEQKEIGIIFSGIAMVTTKDPTRNTLLRILKPGDLFGVANLFNDSPFVSVIRAQGACKICFLSDGAVRTMLENDRVFLYRYLSFLSGRVCYLNQKIEYLTAGSAERRLALYLTSFGQASFVLPTSLSALSELLNLGRASLYRAFDRLCEDGYIQKDGRSVTLLDVDGMMRAYQSSVDPK